MGLILFFANAQRTRERTAGDVTITDKKHNGKIYIVIQWHNGEGSQMTVIEEKQ